MNLKAENRAAGDLLGEVAPRLPLVRHENQRAKLATRLTVNWSGISRFEALEDIGRQIGLTPQVESRRLSLNPEKRLLPVAFAGPFFVEVRRVDQFVPHATGLLVLSVRAMNIPASLLDRMEQRIKFDLVADQNGNNLRDEYHSSWASSGGSGLQRTIVIPLRELLRSAESMTLRGSIPIELPTSVETLVFEPLQAGQKLQAGDVEVTLSHVNGNNPDEPCDITLRFMKRSSDDPDGIHVDEVEVNAYDIEGDAIARAWDSSSDSSLGLTVNRTYPKRPSKLEVRLIARTTLLQYGFELSNVPLSEHLRMPEALLPLEFGGNAAPATMEFVRFEERGNFSKIRVRVTNHSNKPIRQIQMTHDYRDAQGNPLKSELGHLNSERGEDNMPRWVVGAGATTEAVDTAFFAPAAAQSAKLPIRSIEFADATRWEAPK
jgi:hypothetical protein